MATRRATIKYDKFAFGINTDKSLNSIRDGELGAESRNVRITKDDYIEKESGYKGVDIVASWKNVEGTEPNTKNPFKIIFETMSNLTTSFYTNNQNNLENFPKSFLDALVNEVDYRNPSSGQSNVFNKLHEVHNKDFNIPAFEVRRTKQIISKELINAELFDLDPNDQDNVYETKNLYNQIVSEVNLQVLRQIISIKNNGDDKYSIFFVNHTRLEPIRGLNSIKVAFEEYFRKMETIWTTTFLEKEQYSQLIAEFLIKFAFIKSQMLDKVSDESASLFISSDDERDGKVTSLTTINGSDTKIQFYEFTDDSSTSIVKEVDPYSPSVAEVISNEAGVAGINFASPFSFQEIQQDNFAFYGSRFVQGNVGETINDGESATDNGFGKYSDVTTVFTSKSDSFLLELLVGIDPNGTYKYKASIRYSVTKFDTTLGQYLETWDDVTTPLKSGQLDSSNPTIAFTQSQINGIKARIELEITQEKTINGQTQDVVVGSEAIPLQISSDEPTNFIEDFQRFAKCDKYGEFGTRIVKFGYKNYFFITQPLNSTYFNIKLQISNMDEGEEITDIKEFVNGNLIVFSQFRTWRLYSTTGDIANPTSWSIELIADNIGSAFTYSTITIEQRLFVISQRGIFALTKDIYQENNQSYTRIDNYNGKSYEVTIEEFYKNLIKKDIVSVKTDIRNSDFETTFITYDNANKKFINYRIKWSQDSSILRWLIDEAESEFDETTNKFDSAFDIVDTEEIGGVKTGITLNGSIVEYDNDYYKLIDKTYVMKLVTKNFDFGDAFNFKKIKEIDFILFTEDLETQDILFEHRIGNTITTLDNLGVDNVQVSSNGEIQLTNDNYNFEDFKNRSEKISIQGGFFFDISQYDKEHYDRTNIFHSRIRVLGSHKDTVSGVAFYSESDLPLRLGGILFKLALKDKIKGNRQYVGNQNFRGPK